MSDFFEGVGYATMIVTWLVCATITGLVLGAVVVVTNDDVSPEIQATYFTE